MNLAHKVHIKISLLVFWLLLLLVCRRADANIYVVNTTLDIGAGSLRDAINQANANFGADTIYFNIPGAIPHRISPNPQLPSITDTLFIDGSSQNTFVGAPASKRLIEIDGSLSGGGSGLIVQTNADETVLKHLVINNFTTGWGVLIETDNCSVLGCYLGTDTLGMADLGNSIGIEIHSSGKYNVIGGTGAEERCIISGNSQNGVLITDGGTDSNQVINCYIGVAIDGVTDLGNTTHGVLIQSSCEYNIIGGTGAGEGNVISGNNGSGVYIQSGGTSNNYVIGNIIGLDATGLIDVGNDQNGVSVVTNASFNIIGGNGSQYRNIISGNGQNGVYIEGVGTDDNEVLGNFIGLDITGLAGVQNNLSGIHIANTAERNHIGNTGQYDGNVISGNGQHGILLANSQTDSNYVQGNFIGTDSTGLVALANTLSGIKLESGVQDNLIGGSTVYTRNIISGNAQDGIIVSSNTTSNNTIIGNFIGLNKNGDLALPNTLTGVRFENNASNNYLGGNTYAERNVISGNLNHGVYFQSNTTSIFVRGNFIGTDSSGSFAIPNHQYGVGIFANSSSITIGGLNAGEGNVISGNYLSGVYLNQTNNNTIQGNYIGLDYAGTDTIPNDNHGIALIGSTSGNLIGGDGGLSGNYICGNKQSGVFLSNGGTNNNEIYSNKIGVDINGDCLGNLQHGIAVQSTPSNNQAGGPGDSLNVIACNGGDGISLITSDVNQFLITQNSIYGNTGLGIDLEDDGPDVNDNADADNGANGAQNYPVIDSVRHSGGNIVVYGNLHTIPGQNFVIEFYSNEFVNASGYGEGKTYLGQVTGLADGAGNIPFSPTFSAVAGEPYISALSYQVGGGSSEFSFIEYTAFAPSASDDYFVMRQDEPVRNIVVLSNDAAGSVEIDTSSVQIITAPVNGGGVVQVDGSINYTVNAGYYGHDSLQYVVCDKNTPTALCDTAWLRIYVQEEKPISITGGFRHTIISCNDGSAFGAGQNSQGSIGQGTFNGAITTPDQVLDLSGSAPYTNFKQVIATSGYTTLAITQDDSLLSWGSDNSEALGTTGNANRNIPGRVENVGGSGNGYLGNILDAAGTYYSGFAVLSTTGRVLSWGENNDGELGQGVAGVSQAVADSALIDNVVQIDAGNDHATALKRDGTVWSWGLNNQGQIGQNNLTTPQHTPVQVIDLNDPSGYLTGVKKIQAAGNRNIALKWDGTLKAWGANSIGELGDGTTTSPRTSAVDVVDVGGAGQLDSVVDISCGIEHCMALLENGDVVTWGGSNFGELGNGTFGNRSEPDYVWRDGGNTIKLDSIVQIGAVEDACFAITHDDSLFAWGVNSDGQLMLGTTGGGETRPLYVNTLNGCVTLSSPPVAVKDTFYINENDLSQGLNVVANDTDSDGDIDPGSVTVLIAPNYGVVDSISTAGLIYYTPNTNFAGIDTLIYQVCDSASSCDSDTAIIYVNLLHGPGGITNGLTMWYKADYGTTLTANRVDEWYNRANGNFGPLLRNTTEPQLRSEAMNFNPAIEFDGTDNLVAYFWGEDFLNTTDNTSFLVSDYSNGNVSWVTQQDANNRISFECDNDTNLRYDYPTSVSQTFSINSINDGAHLIQLNTDLTTDSILIDGAFDNSGVGGSLTTTSTFGYSFGSLPNLSFFASTDISEQILFNRKLSTAEKRAVDSYLAIKYGLTLDQTIATDYTLLDGTVIYNAATTHDAYDYDIAGIGRNDVAELVQPKSASVNDGAIIEMSQPAHLGDGEYLVWGNNGIDASQSQDNDIPAGFTHRMQKIWRVDKTNDVGVVTIKINISDLPVTSTNVSDYALLISSTTTFAGAPVLNPVIISGDTLTFSGIGFSDNDFFTLAFNTTTPGAVADRLELWLKADAGVLNGVSQATNGQSVNEWQDQSGVRINNATDVNMASPTFYDFDTNRINFNPTVYFDGIDDGLNFFDDYIFSENDGLTAFAIVQPDTNSLKMTPFVFDFGLFSSTGYGMYYSNSEMRTYAPSNTTSILPHSFYDNPVLGRSIYDFGTEIQQSINNSLFDTEALTTTTFDASTVRANPTPISGDGPFTIGRQSKTNNLSADGGRLFQGKIAEVIVYSKHVSVAEVERIESYLAIKYGITKFGDYISAFGTTVWDSAANSGYHNDIAGIGQDDLQGLDQTRSMSVNDSAVVLMEFANSLDDGDYLIWGNNGLAVDSITTTNLPTGYTDRFAKVWKVQETNEVGNVGVKFNLANYPGHPTDASDYAIVVHNGTDFQNATPQTVGLTYNSDTVRVNSVAFNSGDYFTLVFYTNSPPIANNDTVTFNEDTLSAGISVLTNDVDTNIDTTSISVIGGTGPFNGVIDSISNGIVYYTPNTDFNGVDSVDYRVCDTDAECDTARIYITIDPVDDYPIALNDTLIINEDDPLTNIMVTANDSDVDGNLDVSSISIVTNASNGTSTAVVDGSIDYTPDMDFFGNDTVFYRVCDGTGLCDSAYLFVTVNPIDDNPVAINDTLFVSQGGSGSAPVYLNDYDVDGDLDNSSVTNLSGTTAEGATASNSGTGFVNVNYSSVPAFTGLDSVQYQICDGQPICVTAWLYIMVSSGNPPDAVTDTLIINEDTTNAGINVTLNDTDPDGNLDTSTVSILSGPFNGTINSVSGFSVVYTPNADWNGVDTVIYQIQDSTLLSDQDTLFIIVNPVEDNPVVENDTMTIPEDTTTVNYLVIINDSDADNNLDTASISILNAATNGISVAQVDGSIDYTPNADFNGLDSVHYQVCDLMGNCDSAYLYIIVTPVPDTPNAIIDTLLLTQGASGSYLVVINDTDVDNDLDTSSVTSLTASTVEGATVGNDGNGSLIIDYSVIPGFTGWDSVQYRVCDATALCDTAWLYINVAAGSPPIANPDTLLITEDTTMVSINVLLDDTDPDGNLDTSSISILVGPSIGSLGTVDGFGIQYQPMPDSNGVDTIVYQVCDSTLLCDSDTLFVIVQPVNDAPLAVRDSTGESQLSLATHTVTNNDTDVENGLDTSTVTIVSAPISGAAAVVDGMGQISIDYSTQPLFTGMDSLQYRVCDVDGACDSAWWVTNVQVFVPFTLAPDTITFEEGCADITQDILTNDNLAAADIDTSTISIVTVDAGLIPYDSLYIDTITGNLHLDYQTNLVGAGTHNITYTMCNKLGICDTTTVTVIRTTSTAPSYLDFSLSMLQLDDQSYNIADFVTGADIDYSSLTFNSATTLNFGALVDTIGGGVFRINYDSAGVDTVGTDVINYQISDLSCNVYSGSITIDIDPDPEKMIIYDGFSPNGDGINEFWEIRLFRYYMSSNVKIYNRWGNVVYEVSDVMSDEIWNGTSNTGFVVGGAKVPDGTYFYTVELPDYDFVKTGYIIVRGGRQR